MVINRFPASGPGMIGAFRACDEQIELARWHDLARVDAVERFADAVIGELVAARTLTVARARDLTGSSRKHVLPLLQYLDDHGLTRRQGDDRILVLAPDAARARVRSLIHKGEDHR